MRTLPSLGDEALAVEAAALRRHAAVLDGVTYRSTSPSSSEQEVGTASMSPL